PILRQRVERDADALRFGQVAGRRHAPCRGLRARVDRIEIEVLVAVAVLNEQDVAAVPAPEELRDRPALVGRGGTRRVERLFGALHPDVAYAVERLKECYVLAVGRERRAGELGVAEEDLAVDQRR